MKLKIAKICSNDKRFGFKVGDLVLIDTDYDWDPEKVIGVFRLPKKILSNSFYKTQIEVLTEEEVYKLLEE